MKATLLLAVLLLATLTTLTLVSADAVPVDPDYTTTIWVDDDYFDADNDGGHTWETDAFATIEEAITAAEADSVIEVAAGTYEPDVSLVIDGKDGLTLFSTDGAETTIIDSTHVDLVETSVGIMIKDNDVTIDGFTIKDSNRNGIEIYYHAANAHVINNIVTNPGAEWSGIISNSDPTTPLNDLTISNNIISLDGSGSGIYIQGYATNLLISDNTITGATHSAITLAGGLTGDRSDEIVISGNTLSDNEGRGIAIFGPGDPAKAFFADIDITDNTITDNTLSGIDIYDELTIATLDITENDIYGNDIGIAYRDTRDSPLTVNAVNNWWGATGLINIGEMVNGDVTFDTYLSASIDDDPDSMGTNPEFDSLFYNTGDTVTVAFYNWTANADSIRTETTLLPITSDTDTVGFDLEATETGINSGLFTASFPLVPPVNPGAYELGVLDEDEIEVDGTSYADVDDTDPTVGLIDLSAVFINTDDYPIDPTVFDVNPMTYSFEIDGIEFDTETPASLNTTAYTDGLYTITVLATDGAGNTHSNETLVNIDNTGPSVTDYVSLPPVVPPGVEKALTLTASISDAGVEIMGTVTIDLSDIGGSSTEPMAGDDGVYTASVTAPDTLDEGLYNFTITAVDDLDNVNEEAIIVFYVVEDLVNPVIVSTDVDYALGATTATVGSNVTLTVVATDDLSGIASVSINATEIDLSDSEDMALVEGVWTVTLTVGDVLPGAMSLNVTATDYADNEVFASVEVLVAAEITGLTVDLEEGWNMFSLPLIPDDSSIEVVLADVMENVEIVWGYKNGEWSNYLPAFPEFSTLTELVDGEGYWVKMIADDTVTVSGVELPGPGILPPVYEVDEGWNLIGFKSVDTMSISGYLTTIPEAVRDASVSYGWDSSAQAYKMVFLGRALDLEFSPGEAYWLYLTEDANIAPPTEEIV